MAKKTQDEQPQEAEFRSGGHMFANTPYENSGEQPQTEEADEDSEE